MSKYSKLIVRKLKSGKYQGILKYKDSNGKWRQTTKVSKQKLKRDAVPELEQWEKEMNLAAEQMPEATRSSTSRRARTPLKTLYLPISITNSRKASWRNQRIRANEPRWQSI